MSQTQQSLPHFGVRNGLRRHGRRVINTVEKDKRGSVWQDDWSFVSINAAKRFMRTGRETR